MTELEELLTQRKELDKKIKQLTSPNYTVWKDGRLKAELYTTCDKCNGYWCVTVKEIDEKPMLNKHIPISKRLIRVKTKEGAIEGLANIIDSLIRLYEKVSGQEFGVDKQ